VARRRVYGSGTECCYFAKCLTPLTLDILAIPLDGSLKSFPKAYFRLISEVLFGSGNVSLRVLDVT
jgi:hypothetical protein